jgi:PAS domain S-box-containing protein
MGGGSSLREPRERPAWLRYAAAMVAVAMALAARAVFDRFLGEAHPFPFFLAAVALAAWYGGPRPAFLALILGYLAADWFFMAPRYHLGTHGPLGLFSLAVFVITSAVVIASIQTTQRARKRERDERERFRVTLASIGDAVIATDARGLVTFMNAVAEKLTGWTYEEAREKPLQTCFRICNELTRQPLDDPVAKVLQAGVTVGLGNHTILLSKIGKEIPIDDSAAPILDSEGNLVGTILVFRDVTAQRAAELGIRRMAAIVDGSDDAIISKDLRGIVTSWNEGAERLFGYSAAEMVGHSITILIPDDRRNEEQEILARLKRGERVEHFETIRKTKSGERIHVSLTISPIKDGEEQIVGASKIARDITERTQAEEALRQSNARNQAILESAIDGIIVIDNESRVVEFNPAAEKIFGFTRSQLIGQPMADWIVPERLRDRHYQGLASYLATGEGRVLRRRIELPALRANGEEFPVELAIVPVPGSDPPRFTGFVRDLTEAKRDQQALENAQEDLRRMNRTLESQIQERTSFLQQSLKAMETVLYTLAHDLRSPNRAMQGFAELLIKEYGSRLDETAHCYLKRISSAAVKNDALICDLLEYGRLAHAELPMARIDLGEIVKRALHELQPQVASNNAHVHVAEDWPVVWANDSVLMQIILNLLTNALKFVARGVPPSIRIWADEAPSSDEKHKGSPIAVPARATVRLYVQDNGIGVPGELQDRIFQPFQRGSDRHYQGTGMGLAIVQKGAERLGGKVGFTSTPGEGSCFWVELRSADSIEMADAHRQKDLALH